MENMDIRTISDKITSIMNEKNMSEVKKMSEAKEVLDFFRKINYSELIQIINNGTFSLNEIFDFLCVVSDFLNWKELEDDLLISKNDWLIVRWRKEFIPGLIGHYLSEESAVEILSENDYLQNLVAKYVEEHLNVFYNISNMNGILNLKYFQKLLDNEEFIYYMRNNYNFFQNLPEEYASLIVVYYNREDRTLEETWKKMHPLYDKYFEISNEVQLDLVVFQFELNHEENVYGINLYERTKDLRFALNIIKNEDKNFFDKIQILEEKVHIGMKYAISFAHKYYNTSLLKEIITSPNLDKTTIDKIKVLSKIRKVKNIDEIDGIEKIRQFSIEELCKMEKENSGVIVYNPGGPLAQTSQCAFLDKDSAKRQIRIIYADGESRVLDIDGIFYIDKDKKIDTKGISHHEGIRIIYNENNEFPKVDFTKKETVEERALAAAKQIESVTLVIEGEMCLLYMPVHITVKQKEQLKNWLNCASKECRIGLGYYDKIKDEIDYEGGGDTFSPNFVEQILGLTENEKTIENVENKAHPKDDVLVDDENIDR